MNGRQVNFVENIEGFLSSLSYELDAILQSGADSGRVHLSEDVCLYPCQAGHHFHDIQSSLGF